MVTGTDAASDICAVIGVLYGSTVLEFTAPSPSKPQSATCSTRTAAKRGGVNHVLRAAAAHLDVTAAAQ
jgi:hypothetical protein